MSDERREAVAKARQAHQADNERQRRAAVVRAIKQEVGDLALFEHTLEKLADSAIAALDATQSEPTDGWAAIEAGSIERAEWVNRQREAAEPTEAEVEAVDAWLQARHEWIDVEDIRAVLSAARNADQGAATE
jgi:hypothetical protein